LLDCGLEERPNITDIIGPTERTYTVLRNLWAYFCRDLTVHPAVAVLAIAGLFVLAVTLPLALFWVAG